MPTPINLIRTAEHHSVVLLGMGTRGWLKYYSDRTMLTPEKPDNHGRMPLCCAALNGHDGIVKALLGRSDVNPDKSDKFGQTPLACAALNGHEGMVKILLGRTSTPKNLMSGAKHHSLMLLGTGMGG